MPTPAPVDAEVLLRHSKWLRQLARALVARDDEIDDVVQPTVAPSLAAARAPRPRSAAEVPGEALARAELRRRVVESVLALAEPYRSAVILRFFEEQPLAAIARLMKTPEPYVRTRVRRGIALVKEALLAATTARAALLGRLEQLAREAANGDSERGLAGATISRIALRWAAPVVAIAVIAAIAAAWLARAAPHRDETIRVAPAPVVETPPIVEPESAAPIASRVPSFASPSASPAPAATTAAPPASALPKTGTVRGALSDGKGHAIAGAPIWISSATSRTEVAEHWKAELADDIDAPDWTRRPRATTGPDGRYELAGVSPFREWRVAAYAEGRGCALSNHPVVFGPDRAPLEIPLEIVPIVVLHGTVRDRDGYAIPDARVFVEVVGSTMERARTFVAGAASDPSRAGTWTTPPLAGRRFEVSVSADGFVQPGGRLVAAAELGQDDVTVDLVLDPSDEIVMRGPIVDESGAPIDLTKRFPRIGAGQGAHELAADPIELFVFPARTPGGEADPRRVVVPSEMQDCRIGATIDFETSLYRAAVPPGFRGSLAALVAGRLVGSATVDDPRAPPPLVLESSFVASVPTATLALTLVDASTRDVVDDPDVVIEVGRGEPGGELRDLDALLRWRGKPPVTGAPAGRARVREIVVPLGGVTVTATWRGRRATTPRLEFETPGEHREVELELARADAGIRGRVLQVDGAPCEGSIVGLYRLRGSEVVLAPASCETNQQGFFEVAGLDEGSWFVVVRDAVVGTVEAKSPPTEVELHCMPRWPVALKLAASEGGIDLGHATFEILDANGIPETTPERGAALTTMLVPGPHQLVVRTAGRIVSRVPFEVTTRPRNELTLDLSR